MSLVNHRGGGRGGPRAARAEFTPHCSCCHDNDDTRALPWYDLLLIFDAAPRRTSHSAQRADGAQIMARQRPRNLNLDKYR